LERDDSMVHDAFMGQFKSVVSCSSINCERVSTTFDPFVYLSVEVPPSKKRVCGHLVSLDGTVIPIDTRVPENTTFAELVLLVANSNSNSNSNDFACADIWNGKLFRLFPLDDGCTDMAHTDNLVIFEVSERSERAFRKTIIRATTKLALFFNSLARLPPPCSIKNAHYLDPLGAAG